MAAKVTKHCLKFFPRFRSSVFKAQLCISTYLAWTWMFTATYETKAWCLIIKRPATTCFLWQSPIQRSDGVVQGQNKASQGTECRTERATKTGSV